MTGRECSPRPTHPSRGSSGGLAASRCEESGCNVTARPDCPSSHNRTAGERGGGAGTAAATRTAASLN